MKRPAPPRLDADLLLRAYGAGFFPMAASKRGPLSWFSPDPRTIIPLESFNVPRSLSRVIRERHFEIRVNGAFDAVIHGCADRGDPWISREIIEATTELHRRGFAHSVESWQAEELAGGLYGVAIGAAFFGESMFSRTPNASKAALVALVERISAGEQIIISVKVDNEPTIIASLTDSLGLSKFRTSNRKPYLGSHNRFLPGKTSPCYRNLSRSCRSDISERNTRERTADRSPLCYHSLDKRYRPNWNTNHDYRAG